MNIQLLKDFGLHYSIDWRVLYAILMNESSGKGFDSRGHIKNRFESHIYSGFFRVKTGTADRHPSLPGLSPKWIKQHDPSELHNMSYSWGIAQIMGWHYIKLGYKTVEEMITDYVEGGEDAQIKNFLLFCMNYSDGEFFKALKALDFAKIARLYNGAGYARNKYDVKLKQHFNSAKG